MLYDELNKEQKKKVQELEQNNSSTQSAVTVDINRTNNEIIGQYTVIETIKVKYTNNAGKIKYIYYNIALCNNCGHIKKLSTSYSINRNFYMTCINCEAIKHQQSIIGYENENYKVLEFSHKEGKKLYYKCLCKNCNQSLIVRKDSIYHKSKNKGCILCRKHNGNTSITHAGNYKIPTLQSCYNIYKYRYKKNASNRHIEWNLSDNDFNKLVNEPCHYCGALPNEIKSMQRYNKTNTPFKVNGIDRKDSKLGYTVENCVPCCPICNQMKMDLDYTDFLTHIELIMQHKRATTISKESTSQAFGDGSGGHPVNQDDDIVCTV